MTTTTKLLAINEILSLVGINTVADLTDPARQDVLQALQTFDEVLRQLATTRNYFNRYAKITLTPDINKEILITSDIYDVELSDSNIQVVIKNGKLYNLSDNTYLFDNSEEADVSYYLDIDSIPEVVKRYVLTTTARKLYFKLFGPSTHLQVLVEEEKMAYSTFQRWELESADLNMISHVDRRRIWQFSRKGGF
jgi:hypothetical protein